MLDSFFIKEKGYFKGCGVKRLNRGFDFDERVKKD